MFNLILTALYDIVTSLKITNWLELMSIVICIMLLGSPGAIGTILGAGTKLGIFQYATRDQEAES